MSDLRVLIAAGCPHATVTQYRCVHLQEQLEAGGAQVDLRDWTDSAALDGEQPLPYDVLVLQRVAMSAPLRRLIERVRGAGGRVLFDTDDLVFEPELAHWHRGVANLPAGEQAIYVDGVRRYRTTLDAADAVLAASPLLAELAGRHGMPAFVHRNALGTEMMALATQLYNQRATRPGNGPVVIGYGSGTATHDVDFDQAVPALVDIMTDYPEVELWLAGPLALPPSLSSIGTRVRRFPLLDWRRWFELLAQVDINLAPLEPGNVFCRAKSEIKFVEAAALGVPTVASAIDPFEQAMTDGVDGFLAGDAPAWLAALRRLVQDAPLRQEIGAAAQRTAEARYSPAARAGDLAALLPRLLAPPAPTAPGMATAQQNGSPVISRAATHSNDTMQSQETVSAVGLLERISDHAPAAADTPLTINWLVHEPFPGSGGHTGIFRMIQHLTEFGHRCHVHILPVHFMHTYTPARIQAYIDQHFMPTGAIYHRWDGTVSPADATIATYWMTVPELQKLDGTGKRYYLVQDFEPFFYPMGSEYVLAENTYRAGLHCLTLGRWLAKFLYERYGAAADPFDFAVDTTIYYPRSVPPADHPRVAFYARPSTPRRGYELGMAALARLKAVRPDVEIMLYGAEKLNPEPPFPYTNLGILNPWELATLFSSCDVGVVFSLTNPSFVPLEMMACRCAVVDLHSERVEGLLEDGVNCRLAEPTPELIADAVLDLLWDRPKRQAIVERAYEQVRTHSWRHSAQQIEDVLLHHAPPPEARVAHGEAQQDDVATLVWEIHQLLDARKVDDADVDALRSALYQALADKAAVVQQMRQVEARYLAHQQDAPGAAVRATAGELADRLLEHSPAWLQGATPLAKLALDTAPFFQSFRADRSHLAAVELLFAARHAVHTGLIQVTVRAGDADGKIIASRALFPHDIQPDRPVRVSFAPQADSYGADYTVSVGTLEPGQRAFALWQYWAPQHDAAVLWQAGRTLNGQLAMQAYYGEGDRQQSGRYGPAHWGAPIRTAPDAARVAAIGMAQRVVGMAGEAQRLTERARGEYRAKGVRGLVDEMANYVQWQLNRRGGAG